MCYLITLAQTLLFNLLKRTDKETRFKDELVVSAYEVKPKF